MPKSIRLLAISDIQGNFESIQDLCNNNHKEINHVVHTGNFGFWDSGTIETYKDIGYLKQIVAFSQILDPDLVKELNDLSTIVNNTSLSASQRNLEFNRFKNKLLSSSQPLSQLSQYLSGDKKFPCPVYTTFGPLDDPAVISKFQCGEYKIPNLHLIDHSRHYDIHSPVAGQPIIRLYGLGANVKIHSLFDHGNLGFDSLSGKVGDLWITLTQVAQLYQGIKHQQRKDKENNQATINVFVSYAPTMKTPLLEHLAIITNADYTISQGLHFRYPVMGNGMSFVDTMGGSAGYIENYRSKFSRLRLILGELWVIVKPHLIELLDSKEGEHLARIIELGLKLFDKIPISMGDSLDEIVPLTLFSENGEGAGDCKSGIDDITKGVLKRLNDYYFSAYYNLWHFNLSNHLVTDCEYEESSSDDDSDDPLSSSGQNRSRRYNIMVFKLTSRGSFKLDYCNGQGFNFKFKQTGRNDAQCTHQSEHHENGEQMLRIRIPKDEVDLLDGISKDKSEPDPSGLSSGHGGLEDGTQVNSKRDSSGFPSGHEGPQDGAKANGDSHGTGSSNGRGSTSSNNSKSIVKQLFNAIEYSPRTGVKRKIVVHQDPSNGLDGEAEAHVDQGDTSDHENYEEDYTGNDTGEASASAETSTEMDAGDESISRDLARTKELLDSARPVDVGARKGRSTRVRGRGRGSRGRGSSRGGLRGKYRGRGQ